MRRGEAALKRMVQIGMQREERAARFRGWG